MPSVLVKNSLILILIIYSVNCHYNYNYARRFLNYEPPVNVMVDISNQLANNLLFYHSVGNEGNIAFSPSGLINVLIALYEGSDGGCAYEIHTALGLPWERDVIRLGYRDVHRRLRTYFLPVESFQSSLSLNHHNVTLTEAYRSVMRYYGYNFEMSSDTGPGMQIPNPNNNCTNDMNHKPTEEPETESSTTPTTIENEMISEMTDEEDYNSTTEMFPTGKIEEEEETSSKNSPDTTDLPSATEDSSTSIAPEGTTTELPPAIEIVLNVVEETVTDTPQASTGTAEVPTEESSPEALEQDTTITPVTVTTVLEEQMVTDLPELNDATTSISEDTIDEITESTTVAAETETSEESLSIVEDALNKDVISIVGETEATARTGRAHQRDPELVMPFRTPRGSIYTSYLVQTGVLLHASVARLGASVLRLPMPGVGSAQQYHLLIVLPWPGRSLDAVRRSLCHGDVTLRGLHNALSRTWGRALVPKFRLQGLVDLTTDLRQMGVNRVFSPSLSDLRPMTLEPGVFVRAVEQDVNVSVDEPPNQLNVTMSNARSEKFRVYPLDAWEKPYPTDDEWYVGPMDFVVDRPFLFYIMDSELYISLVAGRVLDPTDNRIL